LYAEMYNRAGDKRTSLQEWAEIYRTTTDDYVRTISWKHVHDLSVQVDVTDLREAVGRFAQRERRNPRSLLQLRARGFIPRLPRDPEGLDYRYAPATAEVSYRGGLMLAW